MCSRQTFSQVKKHVFFTQAWDDNHHAGGCFNTNGYWLCCRISLCDVVRFAHVFSIFVNKVQAQDPTEAKESEA